MIEKILSFSIAHRMLILMLTVTVSAYGVYALGKLPIDAVPDITNNQVQINVEVPALPFSRTVCLYLLNLKPTYFPPQHSQFEQIIEQMDKGRHGHSHGDRKKDRNNRHKNCAKSKP